MGIGSFSEHAMQRFGPLGPLGEGGEMLTGGSGLGYHLHDAFLPPPRRDTAIELCAEGARGRSQDSLYTYMYIYNFLIDLFIYIHTHIILTHRERERDRFLAAVSREEGLPSCAWNP